MARRSPVLVVWMGLVLAAQVRAEEPPSAQRPSHSILLQSGELLRGYVVERGPEGLVLELPGGERRSLRTSEVRRVTPALPESGLQVPGYQAPGPAAMEAPPAGPPPIPGSWYGLPIVLIDVAALSIGIESTKRAGGRVEAPVLLCGGAFVLGGPLIHVAHRHVAAVIGSLLLRSIGPVILLGLDSGGEKSLGNGVATAGLAGGLMLGAMVLDWSVFAREPDDRATPSSPASAVGITAGPGGLRLVGRF